ncbi:hypothetical protein EB796_022261 [Bugula neritina]|uniref:Uncharacterized protein n=1 Tax=Bugula neritina TaxID=10212 RepID=A0A7J7J1A6_BUGNE|nr:hypothetical protein EB796_022261 [Bugula neritina]
MGGVLQPAATRSLIWMNSKHHLEVCNPVKAYYLMANVNTTAMCVCNLYTHELLGLVHMELTNTVNTSC